MKGARSLCAARRTCVCATSLINKEQLEQKNVGRPRNVGIVYNKGMEGRVPYSPAAALSSATLDSAVLTTA